MEDHVPRHAQMGAWVLINDRWYNVLEDDDRHLAATLAGQRKGESHRMREERVARLLDDPEKLRELRQQRAERKAGKQQSKGRHMSMRM